MPDSIPVQPLLQTKLYIPPMQAGLVGRSRLMERLDSPRQSKLILISAPAGYGKTTLMSHWLVERKPSAAPVAWLSLGEDDNDPQQFFRYLAAAVAHAPGVQNHLSSLLRSSRPLAARQLMHAFIADVTAISAPLHLVLDDYHVIESSEIDDAMTLLLDHMPPQMQVLLATRTDPDLPIPRLRARGELVELRADHLRFTLEEASAFFQENMRIDLSPHQIEALEARTEGWITGLKMAALAMRGTLSMPNRSHDDLDSFVARFTGSHRFVLDYLVEEILRGQPPSVRDFLVSTSILDRLCGPLCDAVRFGSGEPPAGQAGGQEMLEALERANLFLVPLDDERQWYRYHHLFADVLQARLGGESSAHACALHLRASKWHAQHGATADAVRHALAARDFNFAADLAERAWRTMERTLESPTWLRWVAALPADVVRARPVISLGMAWALLTSGKLEEGEARLQDAEQWLGAAESESDLAEGIASAEMVIVDHETFRVLPASIASARAFLSQAHGDVAGSMAHARRALALFPEGDDAGRAVPAAVLGMAHWASGELDAAHCFLSDAMARFRKTGNLVAALSGTYELADIRLAQGRLRAAADTYEEALRLALAQGAPLPRGTADLYLGLCEIHLERGELDEAIQHLRRSEDLGEEAALGDWPHRLRVVQARVAQAQGDLEGALALLDEAERHFYPSPVPNPRPIAAWRARLWIAQRRTADVLAWAETRQLSDSGDLNYLEEFEQITLARALLAQWQGAQNDASLAAAQRLLARLLAAADAGGRMGSVIEISILQALAQQSCGDIPAALVSLTRALTLAAPEGYVRLFVDEGPPMLTLLQEAAKRKVTAPFLGQLVDAFGKSVAPAPGEQPLIEPLTERELEILTLIAAGLKNKEIARELVISLNTVLYHNKNIYGKLGVNKRTLAIARAREMSLV